MRRAALYLSDIFSVHSLTLSHLSLSFSPQKGFKKCIDLGVEAVELDVFRIADGNLVVFHGHGVGDAKAGDLSVMTYGSGNIELQTYEQLKEVAFRVRV